MNTIESGLDIPHRGTIRKTAQLGIMSEYSLRLMLKRGELPGYYAGTRYYINLDKLLEIIRGENCALCAREEQRYSE